MGIIKEGVLDTESVFALYNHLPENASKWEQVRLHVTGEIKEYMRAQGAVDCLERNGVEIWRLYQWLFTNLGISRKKPIVIAEIMTIGRR